ncbi:unnamed protein product [Polarella glacialis]|uniref:Uncharacterized protein n=1 Tax=Polarella glacialis TaxID=89957 RepID=A0A813DIT4_POLGL|nr:unnamed protein product [Polarella glacialis]CAE8742512.1 unnamed protein product [Polarella glacialis]
MWYSLYFQCRCPHHPALVINHRLTSPCLTHESKHIITEQGAMLITGSVSGCWLRRLLKTDQQDASAELVKSPLSCRPPPVEVPMGDVLFSLSRSHVLRLPQRATCLTKGEVPRAPLQEVSQPGFMACP